jgi:hypothetical protein
MLITFTPDGDGDPVNLAGEDTAGVFDAPQNLRHGAQFITQVSNVIRGTRPVRRRRGNITYTATFTVERSHADYDAAAAFAAAHVAALTDTGTVEITGVVTIEQATVTAEGGATGITTLFNYSIIGTPPLPE